MIKPLQLFIVSGKFLVPGTRKLASVGPQRVVARDVTHACVQLAPFFSDKVERVLPRDVRLTPDFIRLNCKFVRDNPHERVVLDQAAE